MALNAPASSIQAIAGIFLSHPSAPTPRNPSYHLAVSPILHTPSNMCCTSSLSSPVVVANTSSTISNTWVHGTVPSFMSRPDQHHSLMSCTTSHNRGSHPRGRIYPLKALSMDTNGTVTSSDFSSEDRFAAGSSSSLRTAAVGGGLMEIPTVGARQFSARADKDEDDDEDEDAEEYSDFDEDEGTESDGEVIHVNAKAEPLDRLAIENLGLSQVLQDALARRGIARLFPIQEAVMKPAMEGRDIIARARTGTGKTLAFGIPIMERITRDIEDNGGRRVTRDAKCLVLAPTRELAKQVEREFMESAPNLSTLCVYGGVSIEGQIRQLRRGVDVVVGTPGRIIDLIDRKALLLGEVQFMVLDEADQMLAVGFEEDVERIMESLPLQRQTSLFSATMPSWVKKLSRKYLNSPLTIDLVGDDEEKLAEGIRLMCVRTTANGKRTLLSDLITVYACGGKTIVFTQTKKDADEVAMSLGRSVGCEALHGDIAQHQRERTLQAFREGKFSVLVATDVAARGLDIPNVDLVIHYEIPNDPETFVHRSGRTGRAGKLGSAVLMYTDNQSRTLRIIEKDAGCTFERVNPPRVDDVLAASAKQSENLINRVHPDVLEIFMGPAERLLAEKGPSAMAAALAFIGGVSQPPAPRSLLTNEEGWVTVRMVRSPKSRNGPIVGARVVMGTLSEIHRPAADNVGKIKIISSRNVEGAVFDLPVGVAKDLLALKMDNGDVFDLPKELPPLVEEEGRSLDNYGRFGERGGGRGMRGGGRGGRGGGGGRFDRDRSFERTAPRFGGRSSERDSGGFRSGRDRPTSRRRFGTDAGGLWGGESDGDSYGGEDWGEKKSLISRDRGSFRSGGMTFSGVCFLCRQSGHRAADCPSVSSR